MIRIKSGCSDNLCLKYLFFNLFLIMGIPSLFKLLKTKFSNSATSVPLSSLANKTVAIDASGII
jgi:hypothetical protein